jgi:hypothetical protein
MEDPMTRLAFMLALGFACSVPLDPPLGADAATPRDGGSPTLGLPLVVDDHYAAGGYMGDGETPGAIADGLCTSRAGSGRGLCHHFTWSPGAAGWAGVYWQHPDGNWGTRPGLAVPSGASRIRFYAWGARGGETVSFMAGMSKIDRFEVKQDKIALTVTPTQHELSLAATGYTTVVGGFGWVAADATSEVSFFVDDIVWE